MLKGLKKTVQSEKIEAEAEIEPSTVKSTVRENQIKNEVLMEAEQEEEEKEQNNIIVPPPLTSEQEEWHLYEQCYGHFLQGEVQQLSNKLERISQTRKTQGAKAESLNKPNKFEYNLTFDNQKQQSEKQSLKKRNKPIMLSNRVNQYCDFCPDNEQLQLLSASNYIYLALPKHKTFRNHHHFILAPVDHEQSMIGLNDDCLTEINNYKKCLLQAFDKIGMQVVFFEQYSKQNSHIYIECLAMSYNKGQDIPFFFKQSLEDVEGNWATHKSIIKIEKEKGGIQKQIPKPIKYLYIDFSLGYGYAHVIENQRLWKREFVYEVLATALNMESHQVKTTEEYSSEEIATKREHFNRIWADFDWTKLI